MISSTYLMFTMTGVRDRTKRAAQKIHPPVLSNIMVSPHRINSLLFDHDDALANSDGEFSMVGILSRYQVEVWSVRWKIGVKVRLSIRTAHLRHIQPAVDQMSIRRHPRGAGRVDIAG